MGMPYRCYSLKLYNVIRKLDKKIGSYVENVRYRTRIIDKARDLSENIELRDWKLGQV